MPYSYLIVNDHNAEPLALDTVASRSASGALPGTAMRHLRPRPHPHHAIYL